MSKRFLVILLVIMAVFLGLVFLNGNDADAPSGEQATPTNHTLGAGTAGVKLIEYGDFQCPACAQYYGILKQVKDKYGDQITFQFRHFPLTQIHPNAFAAHRAAEAAGMQGKFFEMHDLLYERQTSWQSSPQPAATFEQYAQELGLDMEKYKHDVASIEVNRTINADVREAQELGLTSTPSFVINGQKVEENPRDLEGFYKLIDEAIAKQQENQEN